MSAVVWVPPLLVDSMAQPNGQILGVSLGLLATMAGVIVHTVPYLLCYCTGVVYAGALLSSIWHSQTSSE